MDSCSAVEADEVAEDLDQVDILLGAKDCGVPGDDQVGGGVLAHMRCLNKFAGSLAIQLEVLGHGGVADAELAGDFSD